MSANVRRGGICQAARGVSRGQCFDRGARASARSRRQRIERNRRRTNDFAGSGIREPEVKPEGLAGAGIAEGEVNQRRRRSAAATDSGPHLDALLPQRAGKLDALWILFFDDDGVTVQSAGDPRGCAAERQHGRQNAETPCRHWTTRRAPTHRATHQAPSASCVSSRANFTPLFELWMNACSPIYNPTCVTPPEGCAANKRMSPGCSASTTGVISLPD